MPFVLGDILYLFKVNHYVFRQLHVFKHSLKFASKGSSTFWGTENKRILENNKRLLNVIAIYT